VITAQIKGPLFYCHLFFCWQVMSN